MQLVRNGLLVAMALNLAACVGELGEEPQLDETPELTPDEASYDDDSEEDGDEFESKGLIYTSTQSHATVYQVTRNQTDVQMKPVSTHICFLSRLSGNLGGHDSSVVVHHSVYNWSAVADQGRFISDDAGSVWKVASHQRNSNSLTAEATCVPLADFRVPAGSVRRVSFMFGAHYDTGLGDCSGSARSNMWKYAGSAISGALGSFEGGGEEVTIQQTPGDFDKIYVKTGTCGGRVDNRIEGVGYSFFFGDATFHDAPNPLAFQQLRAHSGDTAYRQLIRTRDGVCFFTHLSGSFDGGGERVRIFPEVDGAGREWWSFEATAEGGSAYADVECISYDQTPPVVL
jgi:hypothetical protein